MALLRVLHHPLQVEVLGDVHAELLRAVGVFVLSGVVVFGPIMIMAMFMFTAVFKTISGRLKSVQL